MNRYSHSLQTLKFDISFSSEGQAIDLHKKISKLSNEKIHAIIVKVFDEELADDHVFVKIDQLEIDLGEILYAELEQVLPEKVYSILKQAVRRQLALSDRVYPLQQPVALKRSEEQYNADALYFFLKKGILPWWAAGGPGLPLEQLFLNSLKTKRREVLAVIYSDSDFLNIIKRVVYQFSDTLLGALVDALNPVYAKQLIDYSTEITQYAGALRPLAYTQRQYKWITLLTFLNPNDQRADNAVKSIVKFFLNGLAAENNLAVPVLTDHFRRELEAQTSINDERHRLKKIIAELLAESAKKINQKTPAGTLEKENADWEKAKIQREETGAGNEKTGSDKVEGSEGEIIEGNTIFDRKISIANDKLVTTRANEAGANDKETSVAQEQVKTGETQPALPIHKTAAADSLIEKEVQNAQTAANNAGDITVADIAPGIPAELPQADVELWQLRQHNRELYQYLAKFIFGYNDTWTTKYGLEMQAQTPASTSQGSSVEQSSADQAVIGQQPDERRLTNQGAVENEAWSKTGLLRPPNSREGEALQKLVPETAYGNGEGPLAIMEDLQPLIRQLLQLKKYDGELYGHIIDFTIQYNQKWKLNKDVRVYARDLFDHIVARHAPGGRGLQILEATLFKMGYRAGKRNQEHPRFREEFNQDKIDAYYIENAGLVLLGPFLATYYERLFLMKSNEFISKMAQDKAAHMLQFLVNGTENNNEDVLLLNKILCGMEITEPVEKEVAINESDKETALSLLNAVRDNWPALKNSSADTFRVEFLQRSGKLNFYNGEWVLRVEHNGRSDYLLDSLPWSFRMIKNSWMPEILNVEWI